MQRRNLKAPKKFKLPLKVPVFPLPGVILFPNVELPLYIFEPRYRKMLADTMRESKCIAISLLKEGWESKDEPFPSYDVVGVGFVKAVVDNPDGTYRILLKGVERARIIKYIRMEPYRVARIRPLPDRIKNSNKTKTLGETLRELFIRKLRLTSEQPEKEFSLPKELADPVILSHFVSFAVNSSPTMKQDILETTDVNCRLKHLIAILQDEILPPESQN